MRIDSSALSMEMNEAIDSRIQAELLKENAMKQWEASKSELDVLLSD